MKRSSLARAAGRAPRGRFGQRPALITLAACLLATAGMTGAVRSLERESIEVEFEHEADARIRAVREGLDKAVDQLESVNRLFAAVPDLRRSEFEAFTQPILAHMPQIRLLAYQRMVLALQRPAFERERQREQPGFMVSELVDGKLVRAPQRSVYRVVDYAVAAGHNEPLLGLDGATRPAQEQAAAQACATGQATMTGLYQMMVGGRMQPGFMLLMPVYRRDAARDRPACEQVEGYTIAAIGSAALAEQTFLSPSLGPDPAIDIGVEVYQAGDANPAALVYHRRLGPRSLPTLARLWGGAPLRVATSFEVGRRSWHVVVSGEPDLLFSHLGSLLMLLLGSGGSVLAAAYVGTLSARERGVARLVKERTAALTQANSALQLQLQAIEACINGIIIARAEGGGCVIEYVNPAFQSLTGYPEQEVIGRGLDVLWGRADREPGANQLLEYVREQRAGSAVIRIRRKDGSELWSEAHIAPCRDGSGAVSHYVVAHYDATEKRRYEAELEHQATHDALTGLANRTLLAERLRQEMAAAARHGYGLWVLFVGLDRFKLVNDSLGYRAGDEFLRTIAQRLIAAVRTEDTVARLGGDEFVLVLAGRGVGHLSIGVVERVMDAIARPVTVFGNECFINASAGIACYPHDSVDPEALIECADLAMHRAKEAGRNNYQFYRPEMNHEAQQRLRTERELRAAVERREFVLHYQAQVDLQSGRVVGVEADVRWDHPELGLLHPERFMPVAADTGLVLPIGAWALRAACTQVRQWQLAGHGELRLALNLSLQQFNEPDLLAQVTRVLDQTGLPATQFELELTERMMMQDVERAVEVLEGLRALGVRIAVDDFGTGYSSLAQLKRFPLDALKIDQSFVRTLSRQGAGAAIPDAIIALAHNLGMRVVAEGVDTESQCAQLAANMCDEVQGAIYCEPLDAQAFGALLAEGRKLPANLLRMPKRERTLLLVDDEPNILAALKRQLRGAGLRILTAPGGKEGLALLQTEQVDVIVSDQRMPGMTGVEFLRAVKHSHPETVRMVLSGFTELQSVTDAVNEGAIYKFLTKPWDDTQLRAHILEAFRNKEMADENRRLDIEVRTANQGLAQANRQLEEVLRRQQEQISRTGISLAIVHEALQHVPLPILGLDEEQAVVYANVAAQALFCSDGQLLGSPVEYFMPELAQLEEGRPLVQTVHGGRYEIAAHGMGKGTRARGTLIIFNPAAPDQEPGTPS
ncbi:EAL domain-containing protein [Massilia horti]|uniref:EAL domain-containing protein n=1 Tax=Massilia horti TaxID=2562153 RepID=UPI001430F007|nr:EAL domain-containing protein [Massilia horti]